MISTIFSNSCCYFLFSCCLLHFHNFVSPIPQAVSHVNSLFIVWFHMFPLVSSHRSHLLQLDYSSQHASHAGASGVGSSYKKWLPYLTSLCIFVVKEQYKEIKNDMEDCLLVSRIYLVFQELNLFTLGKFLLCKLMGCWKSFFVIFPFSISSFFKFSMTFIKNVMKKSLPLLWLNSKVCLMFS